MSYEKNKMLRARFTLALGPLIVLAWAGCEGVDPHEGYSMRSMHPEGIRTVCVQMFHNQTFRREMEYELTRALALQIELHTNYKVVSDSNQADTVMYGSILGAAEAGLTQQRDLDRPVENQTVILVEVTWKDLRKGRLILDSQMVQATGEYVSLLAAGRDSAAREAANEIAVQIVELMETDW